MKNLGLYILFCLCTIDVCAQYSFKTPKGVIDNFIDKSGGVSAWEAIEFIQFEYNQCIDGDSTFIKKFSGRYKFSPMYFSLKGQSTNYIFDKQSCFYKTTGEEWKKMRNIDLLGRSTGINLEDVSPTLNIVMNYDSLESIYSLSSIKFDDNYFVLQKKTPIYESQIGIKIHWLEYLLFSKQDGLLHFKIIMEDDKVTRITQFSEYESFDGYLFPTLRIMNPNNTDILNNPKYNYQFRNGIDGIHRPQTYDYYSIKFNEPIDESFFLLD